MQEILEKIDLGLNIASNLKDLFAPSKSEQMLEERKNANTQIINLRNQLDKANKTNAEELQAKIHELEVEEEQKHYKTYSYFLFQLVEQFSRISDEIVLYYFIEKYFNNIRNNLVICYGEIDNEKEKSFVDDTLNTLKEAKYKSEELSLTYYNETKISKIDGLIENYRKEKKSAHEERKKYIKKIVLDKKRVNGRRVFWIIFLMICSITPFTIIVFLPLSIVLWRKEYLWRKNYDKYIEFQNRLRENELMKEKLLDENIENLSNHPIINLIENINQKHPDFFRIKDDIFEFNEEFRKKWSKIN